LVSPRLLSSLVAAMLWLGWQPASAHHSFAIFDVDHPVELSGTVQQFKFVSPHATIVLEVKGLDGHSTVWTLEGVSPSTLARDGWSNQSLKSGDEIKVTIDPLRSGSPGGAWNSQKISFRDGRPVACCTSDGF
jgi:hypothetical protein